ncbi:ABC transporter permease [Aestuariibacter salexigens]|uniref:ABC transporter permease n=1 Tax=Aestuariibacter salexigens TaxID=226010 RepID=UPI00040044D3|nr:ABC transporter permease [Aestuariibacter salexigens]
MAIVHFSPLDKKRWRDLVKLRGQVLAVALVIASGIATLVMSLTTIEALEDTTDTYYQRYRFADVFAGLTRAPDFLTHRIAELDGVMSVETRISQYVTLDVPDFNEPVTGRLLSIPEHQQPTLNQLVLRKGRWISGRAEDEVIVSENFADAHQLDIGDNLAAILQGSKRSLTVVGIALCPEFIYALGPGALLPDDQRFGILWMSREVLASAFDLKDAFNDVALSLHHGADARAVMTELDTLLKPYGGISAIPRSEQMSNWFIQNEIAQQKSMAMVLPVIFISVAIFLANMVLSRLIATERTEIGLLKAFGYSGTQIAWHYVRMMLVIGATGTLIGCAVGVLFGHYNIDMYAQMFRFPVLIFQPGVHNYVLAVLAGVLASVLGALGAVTRAATLPPAQAMAPPSPPAYRHSIISSGALQRKLDQSTRIAIRQIERWPLRSIMTSTGIGFSVALVIMTFQWDDALNHMARVYFEQAQRQDVVVGMSQPRAIHAVQDFTHLPGVLRAEPMRYISADLSVGNVTHRGTLTAIQQHASLQPIYDDANDITVAVPESGLVIAHRLARKLNVKVGDIITVNVLSGRRPTLSLTVTAMIETYIGMPAYVNLAYINRLLMEAPNMNFVNLLIDEAQQPQLFSELKQTPIVAAITIKSAAQDAFQRTLVDHLMVFVSMFSLLAAMLGFGVAYNSTRIALSERGRELATLRVLGFTRGEISYVLLGEVMLLILAGLGLGCALGYGLVWFIITLFDTELFRIPYLIEPSTYGKAVVIIFIATLLSAALVRRRVDKLDLIRVLKTRE